MGSWPVGPSDQPRLLRSKPTRLRVLLNVVFLGLALLLILSVVVSFLVVTVGDGGIFLGLLVSLLAVWVLMVVGIHWLFIQEGPPKSALRRLVGIILIPVTMFGALLVVAWPLVTAGSTPAKASEARAAIYVIKDMVRIHYQKNEESPDFRMPKNIWDYVDPGGFEGEYYSADDYTLVIVGFKQVTITAAGSAEESRPEVKFTFDATTGQSEDGIIITPQ